MVKPGSRTIFDWQNIRWLTALLGLVLLIMGQFQIASEVLPDEPPLKLGEWLNAEIHLSVPAIDNVLRGLPLLLIGAALLFISLRGIRLLPTETKIEGEKPILPVFLRTGWPWLLVGFVVFCLLLWQIRYRDYRTALVFQWLVALLLIAIAATLWDRQRKINLSPGLVRTDLLWMLGIFIVGMIIGTYRLQGLPDMLMGDEGSFFSIARDIARGDFKPPIFASGVYTFPILSSIGQALVMKVFGTSLWGWRFSSVISGSLTVFPLYMIGRDAFNRKIAILSCIALIINPYYLAFSRIGYNNIQSLFITALALYWLYTGINRSSIFYLFLAGCAAGLGFYTYFAARMALFIAILFVTILWLAKKIKFRFFVLYLGVLLIGAFLVIGPYISYGMQYDSQGMSFKIFESVFFNTFNGSLFYSPEELTAVRPLFYIGGNELFFNPKIYVELIARGLIRTLLYFQKPWLNSEHFIAFPLTGTLGVIFYLIGFGAMFKRIKENRHILSVTWFLVTIFGLSVLNTVPPRHTHMVSIIPLLALLTGTGLYVLAGAFASVWEKLFKYKSLLMVLLAVVVVVGGIYDYFILMPRRYHPNADQVISWAAVYAKDESFLFVYGQENEVDVVHPYLISEFYPDIPYHPISLEEFSQDPGIITNSGDILIFYLPALAEQIEPLLAREWGTKLVIRDFNNPDGIPVISAGMNTPFVFERDRSFLSVVEESYGRIPLLCFLAGVLAILGMAAFIPVSWLPRMPRWIQAFSIWFNAPFESPAQQEEEPFPEMLIRNIDGKQERIENQPPDWADEVFPIKKKKDSQKIKVESKGVHTKKGHDLFFHIHIPVFRSAKRKTSQKDQLSMPSLQIPMPALILIVVILAVVAQILISRQEFLAGAILYMLAAVGLIIWARQNPKWKNVLINQIRIPPRAEIWIGLILLAVIIFTRFYDLGYRVYGLEADETKWTVQSWFSTILRVDLGEFGARHYTYLPVDFWVRSFFLRIFGLNFLSAHIESALYSVITSFFLYLLVRRLTSSSTTALLSTALYAFSFIELNASHQALHDTTVEPWVVAGLYFLIAAMQEKKWWLFQISGVVLALGMLTYETFFPTIFVTLIFVVGFVIYQIARRRSNLKYWFQSLALLLWPILLVFLVFTQPYLASRIDYHLGWLETYSEHGTYILGALAFILRNIGDLLKTSFYGIVFTDSLLRWQGTLINTLILPFAVIGLIYNILQLRKPYYAFIPIWYLMNIIIAPIFLGTVWPRVLYTSIPPFFIWAAIGIWIFFAVLRSWLDRYRLKLALLVFLVLLIGIFANDYRIFISGIEDPIDRVKRRELADLTTLSAEETTLTVYPYMPAQNDSVELEKHVILFSIAGVHDNGLGAEEDFKYVPYSQLMMFLWDNRTKPGLDFFFDKSTTSLNEERSDILNVVLTCYPGIKLEFTGDYFEVYHVDADTLAQPVCYQSAAPVLVSPGAGVQLPASQPILFSWDSSGVKTTGFSIDIEQKTPGTYWIETEDVFQTSGWYASSEFMTGYTGSGFLLDNWQSGEAVYPLKIKDEGQYRVWVRSYKRVYNDQQNYLTVDGQVFNFAGNDIPLDQWYWESIGTFDFPAGETLLGLGRLYGQDDMFSVFIDSIFVTPNLLDPPGLSSVWHNIASIDEEEDPLSSFTLSQSLPPGEYRWNVRVFDGEHLLDSEGKRGNISPFAYFIISP